MIERDEAQALARRFAAEGSDEAVLARIRAAHPGLRFYACSEDDVPPRLPPWLTEGRIAVYLMDASEHCVRLSRDPEHACGLVFAVVAED